MSAFEQLPLYEKLEEITDVVVENKITILSASPGSGKTTLLPYHLVKKEKFAKKILLLESRRIAVRAAAQRIAFLLGEKVGDRVGIRTRDETITSHGAKIEVITEAVLLRMLQNDPSLQEVSLIIFDEFHERTIHSDLAFAFLRDVMAQFNPDLRVLIMSATLAKNSLLRELPEARDFYVEGKEYPVSVEYLPAKPQESPAKHVVRALAELLNRVQGDILVFLPGIAEIRKTEDAIRAAFNQIAVESLHGSYSFSEQKSVIEKKNYRRIVLSTNVAETSLTIEGIEAVIDSGLEKRSRYDPSTAMEHLEMVQITKESAIQRAGRAGRLSPGICIRLWKMNEILTDKKPEILTTDMVPLVLECLLWGELPSRIKWITAPNEPMINKALEVLNSLSLCEGNILTDLGKKAALLPLHPRLARMILLAKRDEKSAALFLAGLLSESTVLENDITDQCVNLLRNGLPSSMSRSIDRLAKECEISYTKPNENLIVSRSGTLLYNAFPERVGLKTGDARYVLSSGRAARTKDICSNNFIIICAVDGGKEEGRIRAYAPVEYVDLCTIAGEPETVIKFEWQGWRYHLYRNTVLAGLTLDSQKGGKADPDTIRTEALRQMKRLGFEELPWESGTGTTAREYYLRLLIYAKRHDCAEFFTGEILMNEIEEWLIPFLSVNSSEVLSGDILKQALSYRLGIEKRGDMEKEVPPFFCLPSGRKIAIDYSGERPLIAGRIQEFFGTSSLPEICGIKPLIQILSPSGRPVQLTDDLAGFWIRTYPEVKKELSGRYPKHFWPNEPLSEEATQYSKRHKSKQS